MDATRSQYEVDAVAVPVSDPEDQVSPQQQLEGNISLSAPHHQTHRRFWDDAINPEDLALFTDTLFYDTDLERWLDGVTVMPVEDTGIGINRTGTAADYDEVQQQQQAHAALMAEEFLDAGDYLGYDFLNFKIPDREGGIPTPSSLDLSTTTGTGTASTSTIQHQKAPSVSSIYRLPVGGVVLPSNTYAQSTAVVKPPVQQPQPLSRASAPPRQEKMVSAHDYSSSLSPFTGEFPNSPRTSSPPAALNPEWAHLSIQEQAHLAVEEDKRRRNTAASARFRIKKKQRDQALERQTKEMADQVSSLERKITQLELENKWLRNLLVEKNEKMMEASIAKRNDGVGTSSSRD